MTWKLNRLDELGVSRYPFGAGGLAELRVEALPRRRNVHGSGHANQPLEIELCGRAARADALGTIL